MLCSSSRADLGRATKQGSPGDHISGVQLKQFRDLSQHRLHAVFPAEDVSAAPARQQHDLARANCKVVTTRWMAAFKSEAHLRFGDRGSPKIRGGVKPSNFQRPLKLTPSYRDSLENPQFGGQKSKLSRGNFRGEFRPPLTFSTF